MAIKELSWVEDTLNQVDFIIYTLELQGGERILDLACGFGRHALEFARRGFQVVGVDITRAYIEDAISQVEKEGLDAAFLCSDIREITFEQEFDVVLNKADGAIGYLENDAENLRIFDAVARALRPGGKHFMDIMNAGYADTHFPCQHWDAGEHGLTLSKFEWDERTRIMLYGQWDIPYGETLHRPEFDRGSPIRLYSMAEIRRILGERNLCVVQSCANVLGRPASDKDIQMLVYSQKQA